MTHLGDKVSALADGQLPVDATERALAHLARCRGCRDAVEAERLMKARLSCLADPAPAGELMARLLAIGGPPVASSAERASGEPAAVQVTALATSVSVRSARSGQRALATGPGGTTHPSGTSARRRPGPRRVRLAGAVLGALGVVGAGVSGLVLAAPATPGPRVPAKASMDSLVVQLPLQTRGVVSVDMSLRLKPLRTIPSTSPTDGER